VKRYLFTYLYTYKVLWRYISEGPSQKRAKKETLTEAVTGRGTSKDGDTLKPNKPEVVDAHVIGR